MKYQSGFRPTHSTLTALIDITDNWYLNIDDGLTNAILFIDLKKPFDTIDHEILLSKMELYGFRDANVRADLLSRFVDKDDWSLNCEIFSLLDSRWGLRACLFLIVGLFLYLPLVCFRLCLHCSAFACG